MDDSRPPLLSLRGDGTIARVVAWSVGKRRTACNVESWMQHSDDAVSLCVSMVKHMRHARRYVIMTTVYSDAGAEMAGTL